MEGVENFVANFININEQKAAEEKIELKERRYRALVQESAEIHCIVSRTGIIEFISDAAQSVLGLPAATLRSTRLTQLLHPNDFQSVSQSILQAQTGALISVRGHRMKHIDGSWCWVDMSFTDRTSDPAVGGIVVTIKDVTEISEKNRALELSNDRYRYAAMATKDLVYDWNLNTDTVNRTGDSFIASLGYDVLEKDPSFWKEILHPEDRRAVYLELKAKLLNESDRFCEVGYRIRRSDGTYAHVLDKGYIIREHGKATQIVGSVTDVSDQYFKESKLALQQALSNQLSVTNNLDESLQRLIELLEPRFGFDVAEAWLASDIGDTMQRVALYASSRSTEELFKSNEIPASLAKGQYLTGTAWKKQEALAWNSSAGNNGELSAVMTDKANIQASMAVPLVVANNVVAILAFHSQSHFPSDADDQLRILTDISNELAMQILRKKSEDEQNMFFELSQDLLCVAGFDANFKKINPAFLHTLGYTEAELLADPFPSFNHPEDHSSIQQKVELLKNGESFKNFETRMRTKAGAYRWISWSATSDVNRQLLFAVGKDVTDQKRFEQDLQKSNEQLKTAQKIAKMGYWIYNYDLAQIYWSDEMYAIWGRDHQSFVPEATSLLECVHEEDQSLPIMAIQAAESDRQELHSEFRIQTLDGQTRWISDTISLVRDSQGKVIRLEGITQDITSRKELESLLKEAQSLAKLGAWNADVVNGTIELSDMARSICGVDGNIMFDQARQLFPYEESVATLANLERSLRSNSESIDAELLMRNSEDQDKWVRVIGKVERKSGKISRIFGSVQDIDERKNAELERSEILESIGDGFFALNENWEVQYWNSTASRLFRTTNDSILGKNIWESFPEFVDTELHRELAAAMEHHQPKTAQFFWDNNECWYEVSMYPKRDGLSVYFKDINLQKAQQAEILQHKTNSDAIINSTSDLIFSLSSDGELLSANESFLKLADEIKIGVGSSEGEAMKLSKLCSEVGGEHIMEALKGKQILTTEQREVNGKNVFWLMSFNPIINDGACIGTACFIKDITEQTLQIHAIEAQNEALKNIAWTQSHLVRAPLARILSIIHFLRDHKSDFYSDDEVRMLMESIFASAEELDHVVKDIVIKTEESNLNLS